jgi:hypothetical protein
MGVELQTTNDRFFRLPSYARPAFVRLVRELDVTGTYKLKKRDLQVIFILLVFSRNRCVMHFDHFCCTYKLKKRDLQVPFVLLVFSRRNRCDMQFDHFCCTYKLKKRDLQVPFILLVFK